MDDTVKKRIDFLDTYKWNDDLDTFHILHLYPKKVAYPDGYYDSKFFELIGFNFDKMEKRNLGRHDSLDMAAQPVGYPPDINFIRIFADGSTLIKFHNPVKVVGYQAALVMNTARKA